LKRKLEQEAKKKDFEDRRQKILDERAAKNGTVSANATTGSANETETVKQKRKRKIC
jgi:hypothetical protein